MAKVIKNIDKIITTSGTEVDLDNIIAKVEATGGIETDYTDADGD